MKRIILLRIAALEATNVATKLGVGDLQQSRMTTALVSPIYPEGAEPRIPSMRLGSASVLTRVSLLERSQKIDDFLLLLSAQLIEILDDPVCFAATALVSSDGFNQVVGPPVMKEKDTLSDAP